MNFVKLFKTNIIFLLLLSASSIAWADTYIKLYVGEVKPMNLGKVSRIAVGKEGIIRPIVLDDGKVLLIPTAAGETDVKIWLKNGKQVNYKLKVMQANMASRRAIANSLLRTFPGLRVRAIDKFIIVEGRISPIDKQVYESIINKIGNVVSLVNSNKFDVYQVRQLLKAFKVDGVQIRRAGKRLVVSGEVDPKSLKALESVTSKIPNITSLIKPKAFISKRMVRLKVQVVEIDSNYGRQLGIDWDKQSSGPTFSFVSPIISNKYFGVVPKGKDGVDWANILRANPNITRADLRFASSIGSRINFLEANGHARTLSRPELLARSGEQAKFSSGGEIPIIYSTRDGPQVLFKEYGVNVDMTPIVNSKNEILLKMKARVSSLDKTTTTSSTIPGIKKVETSTTVNAYSGSTIAIAGLLDVTAGNDTAKIPFLGNIPLIRHMFKNNGRSFSKREVVILITPELVHSGNQNNAPLNLKQEIKRLETLEVPLDRDIKGPGFYTDILE